MSFKGRLGKLVPAFVGSKNSFFLISFIKVFNFILNTRLTISGQSEGCNPRRRASAISVHTALDVNVTNKSGQPYFLQMPMQSWYF
jgi:hypothetical protein